MYTSIKHRKLGIKVSILNLNEEIFQRVFKYLNVETLYFTLRDVCSTIKRYVDNYVKVGGAFILSRGPENTTKMLYLATTKNDITCIHSKTIAPFPYNCSNTLFVSFGVMMKGKIVVVLD